MRFPEPDRPCEMCERMFPARSLTRHHCLPRSEGGEAEHIAMICRDCHGMAHATFSNETLAALFPTVEKLREAPEIERFLKYIRKQPPSRRNRSARKSRRI